MNNKISILGCGWLGEPLAKQLIKKGYSIKGSTTSVDKLHLLDSSGINSFIISFDGRCFSGDLGDFLNCDILVVNLPARKELNRCEPFEELILLVEKSAVKKVVFVSSTSVYPDLNSEIDETFELNESNSPNPALLHIEYMFRQNSHFETTVVRLAGLCGYDRKPANFFAKSSVINDTHSFVNMIHRDDSINIIEGIIERQLWGAIFNGCSDKHPTKVDFYTKAIRNMNLVPPPFNQSIETKYKIISNNKIKTFLNYTFLYPDPMEMV